MQIVRLLTPSLPNEYQIKDVDFGPSGLRRRGEAGFPNARSTIERAPWVGEFDPLEGVILHEPPALERA